MKKFIGNCAVPVRLFMLLPVMVNAESDSSRINPERKAIGRTLMEVQSINWPSVLKYRSDDIEYQDPIVTIQGIDMKTRFLARLFGSTPNLVTIIEEEICMNDKYSATREMVGAIAIAIGIAIGIEIEIAVE
jgi:hypothetical protein